jgi:hypothetical protein
LTRERDSADDFALHVRTRDTWRLRVLAVGVGATVCFWKIDPATTILLLPLAGAALLATGWLSADSFGRERARFLMTVGLVLAVGGLLFVLTFSGSSE